MNKNTVNPVLCFDMISAMYIEPLRFSIMASLLHFSFFRVRMLMDYTINLNTHEKESIWS